MKPALVWPVAGCFVPRAEWRSWLNGMLQRAVALPDEACTVPECADARRKLQGYRGGVLVELALMHDTEIAALNASYLCCAGPTNILSFPASPEDAGLGGLALGLETWRREARLYGQEAEEHARRLLAHGLAHLLGYDHGWAMDDCCAFLLEKFAGTSSGMA